MNKWQTYLKELISRPHQAAYAASLYQVVSQESLIYSDKTPHKGPAAVAKSK